MAALPWWKTAVFYQIYPRSFQDSDDDGIGDLPGILARLDHLAGTDDSLGIDAIWLSPISVSPNIDFGYDVADYCSVDPSFGSEADLRALVQACHERGVRVILDLVVSHTSDQHPWFVASKDPGSSKRDWYLWHTGDKPPNNWASVFGGSAWEPHGGSWYMHTFHKAQPDLNWRNPEVERAIHQVMQYWLSLGIDGFRLDVFNCYLKDELLRDNPRRLHPAGPLYPYLGQHHLHDRDQPALSGALSGMRRVCERYGDAVLLGETLDEQGRYDEAARWVTDEHLHLAFHFGLLRSRFGARPFARAIEEWANATDWPTWVIGNHDFPRPWSRWGGRHGLERAKLAATVQLCLRGTPVIYYGDEIGLEQAKLSRSEIADPPGQRFWPFYRGRDGCRTPMQWDDSPHHGFSRKEPWLPARAGPRTVANQGDDDSLLSWYRALLELRRSRPALHAGEQSDLQRVGGLLTWRRTYEDTTIRVLANLSNRPVRVPDLAEANRRVLLSTLGRQLPMTEELEAHEALLVEVQAAD